jgi:hypothetical protein
MWEATVRARWICAALLATGSVVALSATSAWAIPAAGTPPGSGVSHDKTVCADHGGFAALGTFGRGAHDIGVNFPGSNLRPGATSWMYPNANSGSTTGGNNNSLCGGGNVPTPFVGP